MEEYKKRVSGGSSNGANEARARVAHVVNHERPVHILEARRNIPSFSHRIWQPIVFE